MNNVPVVAVFSLMAKLRRDLEGEERGGKCVPGALLQRDIYQRREGRVPTASEIIKVSGIRSGHLLSN